MITLIANSSIAQLITSCVSRLKSSGRLINLSQWSGFIPDPQLRSTYVPIVTLRGTFLTRERRGLEEIRPLFERKQVRPVIDMALALQEVGKAPDRLDSHHGRGKIVLQIGSDR